MLETCHSRYSAQTKTAVSIVFEVAIDCVYLVNSLIAVRYWLTGLCLFKNYQLIETKLEHVMLKYGPLESSRSRSWFQYCIIRC